MAYNTSNITGQGLGNALSNDPSNAFGDAGAVRELWRKGVEVFEQTTDFFAPMEGGSDAIIETITDTAKGRGQKITFTQMAGLYNEPKHGDELFNDENDFESIKIHTYTLSVDYLRHGVRYTERAEEFMGMRGEIAVGIPEQLGKWMGRQKSEKMFMSFLHHGGAENQIFAGNKANTSALVSADVLDWDTIVAGSTSCNASTASLLRWEPTKTVTPLTATAMLQPLIPCSLLSRTVITKPSRLKLVFAETQTTSLEVATRMSEETSSKSITQSITMVMVQLVAHLTRKPSTELIPLMVSLLVELSLVVVLL